jgi:hypothetical protein
MRERLDGGGYPAGDKSQPIVDCGAIAGEIQICGRASIS